MARSIRVSRGNRYNKHVEELHLYYVNTRRAARGGAAENTKTTRIVALSRKSKNTMHKVAFNTSRRILSRVSEENLAHVGEAISLPCELSSSTEELAPRLARVED